MKKNTIKNKTLILWLVGIIAIVSISPVNTFASTDSNVEEDIERITIDAALYENFPDELDIKIKEALISNSHVRVINTDQIDDEFINDSDIESKSAAGQVIYQIKNQKSTGSTYGENYHRSEGSPGIKLGIEKEEFKTYSIGFGATFGCPKGTIANANWGTTKGKKLRYWGTWTVPKKNNGKKVKKGILRMRPVYSNKSYDIYSKTVGYTEWKKKGRSTTKRAYAVDFDTSFTYK